MVTIHTLQQVATHEAAHAVILFLVGKASHIERMSTHQVKDSLACVESTWVEGVNPSDLKIRVLLSLAGHLAQNRVDQQLETWEVIESMDALTFRDTTNDYSKARDAAAILGDADEVILKLAGWTEELLDEPMVWKVVTTLASSLEPDSVLDGKEVRRIMEGAWEGQHPFLPVLDLSPKWRRRLFSRTARRPAATV